MHRLRPLLAVHYNGESHRLKISAGKTGRASLLQELQQLLGRDLNSVNIVFRCISPDSGKCRFHTLCDCKGRMLPL